MREMHTVDQLVRAHADATPDKPMVIDPESRITYGELDTTTLTLGDAFIAAGIGSGTRVGLIMPNGCEWVRTALALIRIGAVLVPMSTLLAPPELRVQLRTAAVTYLISVGEFRGHRYLDDLPTDLPDPELPALQHIWTTDTVAQLMPGPAKGMADAMSRAVRPADPMVVMFTSGSAGTPKGVIHSHGNALAAVASGLTARCIDADTRLYLPMPFFWVGGFGAGILTVLLAGATLVTEPTPSAESTVALLQREAVTLFRGWPAQAENLARQAGSGQLKLPALRPGSLEALLPIALRSEPGARASLFGMTETFGPYCGYRADTDMPRTAWGSCGQPFPGMDIRIVDPLTSAVLRPGHVGAVEVRGSHVMRGMCRRTRAELFTSDGYYRTGDRGHLDDDGFLFFDGRADDMFKVSGATVYPSEVAAALRTIPGVHAAYVTNLFDNQRNRVAAAVICDAGMTSDALRTAARQVLSPFKVPTVWALFGNADDVPYGATGKVDVSALRALLGATTRHESHSSDD